MSVQTFIHMQVCDGALLLIIGAAPIFDLRDALGLGNLVARR
jgi:hypothetical protein